MSSNQWSDQRNLSNFIENQRLRVQQRRGDSPQSNNIRFVNPASINSIQATVNVQENSVTDAFAQARVVGTFCDTDNTANGFTNDILAATSLGSLNGSALAVNLIIFRCADQDCNNGTTLLSDDTTFGPPSLNTDHVLSVAFDNTTNIFTFGFDGNTASFGPAQIPELGSCGPSNADFKAIGSRIGTISGTSSPAGDIVALFDDIMVNGAPYDNFDLNPGQDPNQVSLNPNNWRDQDLDRTIIIDNNAVRLEQMRLEAPSRSNNLSFANPSAINSIRTDVRIDSAVVVGTGNVRARTAVGDFFNDGASTGPNDLTGDVFVQLSLLYNPNATPQNTVFCSILRIDDPDFINSTEIFFADLGTWVEGTTYSALFGFDPTTNTFVCEFDGQRATYTLQASDPQPVAPPAFDSKSLATRIAGLDGSGEFGFISAVFDNVEVNVNLFGDTSLAPIPTLSQWAMMLIAMLLVISAGWTLRRRA